MTFTQPGLNSSDYLKRNCICKLTIHYNNFQVLCRLKHSVCTKKREP